jgi:hypothetical protein
MVTARARWVAEIRRTTFPVGMRPVKATLLSLPIQSDGVLSAWRDDLINSTGLPAGTLKRHLLKAVEAGWLVHEVRGGHGRRGAYRAALHGEVVAQKWTTKTASCGRSTTPQLDEVVAHLVGQSKNKSANAREHGALDPDRDRRTGHDDSRDERDQQVAELRIDERAPAQSRTSRYSPRTGACCRCCGLRTTRPTSVPVGPVLTTTTIRRSA